MKKQLDQIYHKKKIATSRAIKNNSKYLVEVYKAIIEDKNLRQLQKAIRNVTIRARNDGIIATSELEALAVKAYKRAKRQTSTIPNLERAQKAELALGMLVKLKTYQKMSSEVFKKTREQESENKEELIKDFQEDARENKQVFYLCSSHDDCAEDHKKYQGRIYIDAMWENYIDDPIMKKLVQEYIRKNNILTFQYITFRPVWLITRPNCRHYFKALDTDEVLESSKKYLIRKYKMKRNIGVYQQKTIPHDTRKVWYTKSNVENITEKYKERLEYHQELAKVEETDMLRKIIEKDKLMVKKWSNFLQKF